VYLIAARAENNVIGKGSEIPWRVQGEQRLFREITTGNTLVMGRKTYESIGKPLPGRDTVIVTRQADLAVPGCSTASSLEEALQIAAHLRGDTFVAGGGEIYQQAIAAAQGIHLTTIHAIVEGDIFFPDFEPSDYVEIERREYQSNINYTYQFLKKRTQEKHDEI
jgi:dihydrofolate reductase (trimethoprim resistance protein)